MTWWHGGPPIAGDELLPPTETGTARSGEVAPWIFVTSERSLALTYASTCDGWLYEVDPVGLEQDPGSMLPPGQSMRCQSARIIRRFRPSRMERERALRAVQRAATWLDGET